MKLSRVGGHFSSHYCTTYPVSLKTAHFYFCDNSGKSGLFFIIFFTVKFRKDLQRKLELKLPPPLKSVATLPLRIVTIQLYRTVNSVQSDAKTFNYSKYSRGCYIYVCLHIYIDYFYHVFKRCAVVAYACFEWCTSPADYILAVPRAREGGLRRGENFRARLYYSQRAVFASHLSAFSFRTVSKIGDFGRKLQIFPHPVYLTSPLLQFPLKFCNGGSANTTGGHARTRRWKELDDMCFRLHTIPQCVGQTDRRLY